MSIICEVCPDLGEIVKKFRFRRENNIAAIIMKANTADLLIKIDKTYNDVTIEEIAEDLPTAEPRYILLSYVYNHGDGRVSFPLVFIFYCPPTKTELMVLYAASMVEVVQKTGQTKTFELRSSEELTEEWLNEELAFFK